jgi:LSD1 subclass zinc finger protein
MSNDHRNTRVKEHRDFPGHFEVCPACRGHGKYVNPSIDGNGLSEDCVGDSDFMDEYRRGSYDVRCECCQGQKVVWEVDFSKCSFSQRRILVKERDEARAEREYARECAAERRACGCY